MTSPATKTKAITRPTFKATTLLALCAQVNQICPKCGKPLFIKKGKNSVKDYEIAHIYPLNPTLEELNLLHAEAKMCADPNDELNLIPLCFTCHKLYDTDKTVEDYRGLKEIKQRFVNDALQLRIFHDFKIEVEISDVVEALMSDTKSSDFEVDYIAKEVDTKLKADMSPLTKRKIKNDVSSFYLYIRDQFAEVERKSPHQAEVIAHQVKVFYLKQKSTGLDQQTIYQNTIRWIRSKSPNGSEEASAAIAAFFVQNCELF